MTTTRDRANAACIDEEYCVPYSDADMRRDLEQLARYARAKGPGGAVDMVMSQSEHIIKRVTGDRIASTQVLREAAERLLTAWEATDERALRNGYEPERMNEAAIALRSAIAADGGGQ